MPDTMDDIAARVLAAAKEAEVTMATAESCTGGRVAAAITSVPGASGPYLGGVVAYSNDMKISLLGVEPGALARHGAVSPEIAAAMAEGARHAAGADLAVATTGIAGPGGGTHDKPVGTVWFGLSGPTGTTSWTKRFEGDREAVQRGATREALEALLRVVESAGRGGA